MATNTAKMDTLIITMGTGAIQRKVILITIMGLAEITTMVTERTTIMGMELTQRKVTWITMASIRRKATTMAVTTTTTTVRLQTRENKRKNKVRAAPLLMAAANKEGTSSRRGYNPSAGLNTEQGNYECVCLLYYWQQHNNTLGSRG